MTDEVELERAHKFSRNNRSHISCADGCGCFFCKNLFPCTRILKWSNDGTTAICPICGVDAVLSSNVSQLTDDFLSRMHDRWFKKSIKFTDAEWKTVLEQGRWPSTEKEKK